MKRFMHIQEGGVSKLKPASGPCLKQTPHKLSVLQHGQHADVVLPEEACRVEHDVIRIIVITFVLIRSLTNIRPLYDILRSTGKSLQGPSP